MDTGVKKELRNLTTFSWKRVGRPSGYMAGHISVSVPLYPLAVATKLKRRRWEDPFGSPAERPLGPSHAPLYKIARRKAKISGNSPEAPQRFLEDVIRPRHPPVTRGTMVFSSGMEAALNYERGPQRGSGRWDLVSRYGDSDVQGDLLLCGTR